MTGMFVATNSPMAPGTRVRVEVVERERGFMVEGVVAHARKIRGDLARLTQSGMGVRFLSVEELVRELIPATHGQTEEVPQSAPGLSPSTPEPPPLEELLPPVPDEPPLPSPPPLPPAATSVRPAVSPAPAPIVASEGAFSVRFGTADEFLGVFQRDILQGGLFVSTRYPARLQETVTVELQPPLPYAEPVLVRARVVQRFDPGSDPHNPNLLSGMGLELIDLPALVEKLRPVVQRMQE